ncbi:MAG: hypothetical protein WC479_11440, partial [Candidatus Izemoplasmatales bacterium]
MKKYLFIFLCLLATYSTAGQFNRGQISEPYIDSANPHFTGSLTVDGNAEFNSDVNIDHKVTVGSGTSTGNFTVSGTLLNTSSTTVYGSVDANNVNVNEGVLTEVTITGTTLYLTISSVEALFRSDTGFNSNLIRKTIPQAGINLSANTVYWLVANYNSGNPVYQALTSNTTINNSTIIPVARISMDGTTMDYHIDYGTVGRSAAIRNFDRAMRIRGVGGIERESGFTLTETATRIVNVAAGVCWFGLDRISTTAVVQNGAGIDSDMWYHQAGNWTKMTISSYNVTNYDDGTDIQQVGAGKYVVNWIFRNIANKEEVDIVLGTGNYNAGQAEASTLPALPPEVQNFYVLCGRIIVLRNASSAYAIESAINTVFQTAAVSDHGDLSGLTDPVDHLWAVANDGSRTAQTILGNITLSAGSVLETPKLNVTSTATVTTSLTSPIVYVASVTANNTAGLMLGDDANNGIFINDGGNVSIGKKSAELFLDIEGG